MVTAVLVLADPATACLKRVIVLEGRDVGFPPFSDWKQQRLKLAQISEASAEQTAV